MHALLRKISSYTAPDILLGVFFTELDAQNARGMYLAQYAADPSADPWHKQNYKMPGLTSANLQITRIDSPCKSGDGDEIFVVSSYEEMFGQISRDLDSVHATEVAAQNRITEIEHASSDVSSYALFQCIRVGAIQSDKPDQQPRL